MDVSVLTLDEPLSWLHCENAIPHPHVDDEAVVVGFREFLPKETIAQLPQLITVEIADKRVHELGPRGCRRPRAVLQQLFEDVGTVDEHVVCRWFATVQSFDSRPRTASSDASILMMYRGRASAEASASGFSTG
jgi:hypothetical protein